MSSPTARWPTLSITLVLLIAAAMRLQAINQPFVDVYAWRETDNAWMADGFAGGDWNIFLPQVGWGGPGPNYLGAELQTVTYLTALGYRVFGVHPWVGRTVCVAFGLWGVFALYRLVSLVWGRRRGLAAAAVMAVLPGSAFVERSFVSDGAMCALLTTSLWMLVAYGRTEKRGYLLAATLTGMLGCLTKITGGVLVIPAAYAVVSALGPRWRDRAVRLRLLAAAAAVALPVATYYLWARHVAHTYPPYHLAGKGKFLSVESLSDWIRAKWFVKDFLELALGGSVWTWPFAALAFFGVWLPLRRSGRTSSSWLFHAWMAALLVRYSIEAKHLVTDPSNIHLFNPVVAAYAGHALAWLAGGVPRSRAEWLRPAAAALVFVAAATWAQLEVRRLIASPYYAGHAALGSAVAELTAPGELVISMGLEPIVLYHSRRFGWLFPPSEEWSRPGAVVDVWDYGEVDLAVLDRLLSRGARWLAIASWNDYAVSSDLVGAHSALARGIEQRFEIVRELPEGVIMRARER